MLDVLTVNALSTIMLLMAIEAMYPGKRWSTSFWTTPGTITPNWSGLAGATGMPDQAAFRPGLLPASQPDRTAMGVDAQAYHPQQVLSHFKDFSIAMLNIPARRRAQELARLLR